MEKILKILKGLLDKLPLDGDKLKISLIALAYGAIRVKYPELDLGDLSPEQILELGMYGFGIAIFHKWLKVKFPKLPEFFGGSEKKSWPSQ